jgi:hypothetical protein
MRPLSLQPLNALVAWDRNPWTALTLRLGTALLLLRPWSFRVLAVPLRAEELDPGVVAAVRAAGVDPFDPAAWPTATGTILRALAVMAVFALVWWGVSRLRHLVVRRFGPGVLAVALLLVAYVGWLFLGHPLTQALMVPGSYQHTGVPVWQAWVFHPRIHPETMEEYLQLLGLLAFVGVELLLLVAEGRMLLSEARDGALRARLSPHFLFNTLNTLEAQIEDDPLGALDTTQRLSALFEQVQKVTDRPTTPLREELALVEDVLALERQRLGERLRIHVEVPEELLDRPLPVLALQVLVENAIRHAIAPRVEGGTVLVRAEAEGTGLRISVEDSGDGVSRGRNGTGRALANLRARLRRPSDLVLEPCDLGFRARFRWV